MRRPKLAIVTTHPIQYYAPVFRALAASPEMQLRVFYTWSQAESQGIYDAGFGAEVKWDVPLLEGYEHRFVANVAARPGVEHFAGLQTPSLVSEITAWEADAVLVYTWNSWSHLQALRGLHGRVPVLFRGDSTLLDARPWWRAQLRRLFLTWVYRHVDVAIAVGTANRRYFEWCAVPPEHIALAPHTVDVGRFAADAARHEARAADWRQQLGIAADDGVILFAGKLQSKKNPRLLLDAFARLPPPASPHSHVHLVFVGNGELEAQLKAAARGVPRVHFLPFQNQSAMPAVYRLGDVFVLPSQGPGETWGLALNEALASGRPIIASDKAGGAIDLIRQGVNGWMFESGNADDLERILRAAMDLTPAGLRAMGVSAQQLSASWSSEESARRICKVFLECLPECTPTKSSRKQKLVQ
jgi:glycosyltransferase involved in cell wall biosynthesis